MNSGITVVPSTLIVTSHAVLTAATVCPVDNENVAVSAVKVVALAVTHPESVTPSPSAVLPSASVSTPREAVKSPVIVTVVAVTAASFTPACHGTVPSTWTPFAAPLRSVIVNEPASNARVPPPAPTGVVKMLVPLVTSILEAPVVEAVEVMPVPFADAAIAVAAPVVSTLPTVSLI